MNLSSVFLIKKNFLDSEKKKERERERIESIISSLDSSFSVEKMFFGWKRMHGIPTFFEGKSWRVDFRTWRASLFSITGREKTFENETVQPSPSFFQMFRKKEQTNDSSFHFFLFQNPSPLLSTYIAELRYTFLFVFENRREEESWMPVKLNNFSPILRKIH